MFKKEMKLIDDVEALVTMRAFTFTHEIGLSSIIIKKTPMLSSKL